MRKMMVFNRINGQEKGVVLFHKFTDHVYTVNGTPYQAALVEWPNGRISCEDIADVRFITEDSKYLAESVHKPYHDSLKYS